MLPACPLPSKLMVVFTLLLTGSSLATKLADVKVVDKDYIEVYFKDGEVTFVDDGRGPSAFLNLAHDKNNENLVNYGAALNTTAAAATASWKLASADDPAYGAAGLAPVNCYRRSKLNGMYEGDWAGNDFSYSHTMEHHLYLKLPSSMAQGKSYTLKIDATTNSDSLSKTFTYDIYKSKSEAVHVNLVGYTGTLSVKAADLYCWLGDGGARDYSLFVGNKVYLINAATGVSQQVGAVALWKTSAGEAQGYNFTLSNVWKADFTGFSTPGVYHLSIEGVGSSQDFTVADNIYHDPFLVNVRGYFYMRVGQDSVGIRPVPRRPLYIPGKDPVNTVVYITTMQPTNANWGTFSGGDVWDNPDAWAPYKNGKTNANAYGGHADAADWDRHLGHISNSYDMLLPYILTNGALSDDNLGIAESGNGIPDIIDEARNEVDYWLRLRDGPGYAYGVTNPNGSNVLYQAGTNGIAAWAAAASAAMLGEAFRIAGKTALSNAYRDSAVNAYNFAGTLADPMLDFKQNVGESTLRGRDLKMTAAAYLYNLTGSTVYEDVVSGESKVTNATSAIIDPTNFNQIWATAGYLKTNRTVHYQALFDNMKASVINDAKTKEANFSNSRPSRRGTDNNTEYFHTEIHMHRTLVAHAITTNQADRDLFENALTLEADWSLGRNGANLIQMTTASTPLASKRSVEAMYISGGNDGTPGQHPGMTPYFNADDWGGNMIMGKPSWMCQFSYPSNDKWPKSEVYFNTRFVYAHSEFTPQQTMRGKLALYGYLYGIRKSGNPVKRGYETVDKRAFGGNLLALSKTRGSVVKITIADGSADRTAILRVYNCTGRLTKTIIANETAPGSFLLETSRLGRGIYLLEVVTKGKRIRRTVSAM
jgi:endoglucanase